MLTNVMNFAKLAGIEISPNETKRQTELLTIGKNLIQDQLGNGGESRTAAEVSISLMLALTIGCWCYILICKQAYTLIYWGVFGCIWDWISKKGCGFWDIAWFWAVLATFTTFKTLQPLNLLDRPYFSSLEGGAVGSVVRYVAWWRCEWNVNNPHCVSTEHQPS